MERWNNDRMIWCLPDQNTHIFDRIFRIHYGQSEITWAQHDSIQREQKEFVRVNFH